MAINTGYKSRFRDKKADLSVSGKDDDGIDVLDVHPEPSISDTAFNTTVPKPTPFPVPDDFFDPAKRRYKLAFLAPRVVSLYGSGPTYMLDNMPMKSAMELFKEESLAYQAKTFDHIVRFWWIFMHATSASEKYAVQREPYVSKRTGDPTEVTTLIYQQTAVAWNMRNLCQYEPYFHAATPMASRIATYLLDFFPNFLNDNPFTEPEKFKWPYEHVTISYLLPVFKLEDRLRLLQQAERDKMSLNQFLDYSVDFVCRKNAELGKERYSLVFSSDIAWNKSRMPTIVDKLAVRGIFGFMRSGADLWGSKGQYLPNLA